MITQPVHPDFIQITFSNRAIDQALYKSAPNLRVGGELKFNTLMVRLGGAYYGNPYKDVHEKTEGRYQAAGLSRQRYVY